MKTLQLPLSNKQVDIKLNPLGIIEAKKEVKGARIFHAMYEILKNGIEKIDGQAIGYEDVKKLPYVDCEYIVFELMRMNAISPFMTMNGLCPICKSVHQFADTKDGDTRINLKNIDLKRSYGEYEESYFTLKPYTQKQLLDEIRDIDEEYLDEYTEWTKYLKKYTGIKLQINAITFRHPTLDDMLKAAAKAKDDDDFNNKLYYSLIDNVDYSPSEIILESGETDDIEDMKQFIAKYRFVEGGLLSFAWDKYFERIQIGLHTYGLKPYFSYTCDNCKNEYDQIYSFASFFASGLLPSSVRAGV